MNPAQKRTLWTFAISLLTLLITGVIIAMALNGQIDFSHHTVYRIGGICSAIPLILIVLLSKYFPGKSYDERDLIISKKAVIAGIIGTFIIMALAAWLLMIQDFKGNIKIMYLTSFVYITAFVWFFLSSAAGIVFYYFSDSFTKDHNWQGEPR